MAKRQKAEPVNGEVVEPPRGIRGRLERLYVEYAAKANALKLTADILDEDDRRQALVTAPRKLLAAINYRNGANGNGHSEPTPTKPIKERPPIFGKRLTLFLLEHLDDSKPRTREHLLEQLAAAGSPVAKPQSMNGPIYAALVNRGRYAKITRDGSLVLTAKGRRRRDTLRQELESEGRIVVGGYLKPSAAAAAAL